MRVVLDSNIWISGYFWTGRESDLVLRCTMGEITSIISPAILEEVRRTLLEKFRLDFSDAAEYLGVIMSASIMTYPVGALNVINEDKSDNLVLETAIIGDAGYIVTGDHHLLRLGAFENIRIVQARELLWMLDE